MFEECMDDKMENFLQREYTMLENTNVSLDVFIISCIHYIKRKFHDMIPVEYNNNNAQIHILNMTYTCASNNEIMSDMICEDDEI